MCLRKVIASEQSKISTLFAQWHYIYAFVMCDTLEEWPMLVSRSFDLYHRYGRVCLVYAAFTQERSKTLSVSGFEISDGCTLENIILIRGLDSSSSYVAFKGFNCVTTAEE